MGLLTALLARSRSAMAAAEGACHLFVTSVMPGLFPYMTLTLLLAGRLGRLPAWGALLLGWGGGSPTGAQLAMGFSGRVRRFLLIAGATMSPMFLLGTVGKWLNCPRAGIVVLVSVLGGALLSGWIAPKGGEADASAASAVPERITLAQAIERAMRTMLTICGTMMLARTLTAVIAPVTPQGLLLPLMTLLEASTGIAAIAQGPWPLVWRTALIAGAAGFGGLAILLQNRSAANGALPLGTQLFWQGVHALLSFLLALGMGAVL